MTSKLTSLARIVFQGKAATIVTRSAPAAILQPIQRLFGETSEEDETVEEGSNNVQERLEDTEDLEPHRGGILASLAAQTSTSASGGPIASSWAKEALKESIQSYYRQAKAPTLTSDETRRILEEPDLSVPVGDDYIYLPQ